MPQLWTTDNTTVPGINNVQYGTGDAFGTKIALTGLPEHGIIKTISLTDLADQDAAFDLILFDADITSGTNNSAYDMADADASKILGHIAIVAGNYSSFADNSMATQNGIDIAYILDGGAMTIQCVARGTPTYAAAGDVVFRLTIDVSR
jgi:hypothetical protein